MDTSFSSLLLLLLPKLPSSNRVYFWILCVGGFMNQYNALIILASRTPVMQNKSREKNDAKTEPESMGSDIEGAMNKLTGPSSKFFRICHSLTAKIEHSCETRSRRITVSRERSMWPPAVRDRRRGSQIACVGVEKHSKITILDCKDRKMRQETIA